jgi:NAD(P)-dependent dehydrogenase (short-subunit alcohol dehydrogenase family)
VQSLWDLAVSRYGRVDIWINNAGVAHPQSDFYRHSPDRIRRVVSTNLLGAMYGARVAILGMTEQGHGALYNMEGLGSSGPKVAGMALYGSTKAGLRYLTDSLVQEMKGTPVIVGAILPGMVATDLLLRQYDGRPEEWERAKPVLSILSDRVENVTPWLASRILANRRHGARIRRSNMVRIAGRFVTALFTKRDPFSDLSTPEGR